MRLGGLGGGLRRGGEVVSVRVFVDLGDGRKELDAKIAGYRRVVGAEQEPVVPMLVVRKIVEGEAGRRYGWLCGVFVLGSGDEHRS
jgi:hypothetical protein